MRTALKALILNLMWTAALRRYHREQPKVVAVGGSVGKTSTKDAIVQVLQQTGRPVRYTFGNMATDSGVALSLLGFTDPPAGMGGWFKVLWRCFFLSGEKYIASQQPYYVLEYSSDAAGDTDYLTKRIKPDIAVLATLVPVHMESYKTEAAMIEETLRLTAGLEPNQIVANVNDPHQRKQLPGAKWYGLYADKLPDGLYADQIKRTDSGLQYTVKLRQTGANKALEVHSNVFANYQLLPMMAATAVGLLEGLSGSQIKEALESYKLPAGRGRLIEGLNEMTIIDDSANSSPEAVKAGLTVLKEFAGKRHKVAILGTMNELGEMAEAAHKEIGKAAAGNSDFFVAVGKYKKQMLAAAKSAGLPATQMIGFDTPEKLIQQLGQIVHRHDVIYVKASQNGMYLERVVKALMAHPEQAAELLVRQGKFWHKH